MTIEEWWEQIERHLLDRNWVGVAVCADGLEESGEERLAGTLRWIARQKVYVGWVETRVGKKWYAHPRGCEQLSTTMGLKSLILMVESEREWYIEYWS